MDMGHGMAANAQAQRRCPCPPEPCAIPNSVETIVSSTAKTRHTSTRVGRGLREHVNLHLLDQSSFCICTSANLFSTSASVLASTAPGPPARSGPTCLATPTACSRASSGWPSATTGEWKPAGSADACSTITRAHSHASSAVAKMPGSPGKSRRMSTNLPSAAEARTSSSILTDSLPPGDERIAQQDRNNCPAPTSERQRRAVAVDETARTQRGGGVMRGGNVDGAHDMRDRVGAELRRPCRQGPQQHRVVRGDALG
eukprot:4483297-Prymnesium_polylepis.2